MGWGVCRDWRSRGRRGLGAPREGQRVTRRSPPRRCSVPPLSPTPESRSSRSRQPCRFFVTRFRSFRERAGGSGSPRRRAIGGHSPVQGDPRTPQRAHGQTPRRSTPKRPHQLQGTFERRRRADKTQSCTASTSRNGPKDSNWGVNG